MKTYIPTDDMRDNPLSKQPGGSVVRVVYQDHEVVYDKIKNPGAYIRKITMANSSIVSIYVNEQLTWPKKK